MDFIKKLFDTDFMPHGHCYMWRPEIVWTNAVSDSIIAIAYLTIPLSLIYIVKTRKDFKYYWILVLFALFILGCGATHVMDVINIWSPMYRLDSSLRVITALASIGTAIMLVKLTPEILLIPNADIFRKMNKELKNANRELENSYKEIALREEQLRRMNLDLEEKIEERTKALRESEERFRTLADNIPNLAWMGNSDGWIFWYNKRWYEYTGTSSEQMVGWGWQSVHDPHMLPHVMESWTDSIKSGEPFDMVIPLKGKHQKFRPFLTRVVPVKDSDGKIVQWFGTSTDISDQVENEKILENKNKELAKINADLDNFVYTASHDLKAPISNIEGLAATMKEVLSEQIHPKEEFREVLDMINMSIAKFKNTIQDLTEIARVQRNVEEDIDTLNVCELVEDIKLLMLQEITTSKATINLITHDCPAINFSKRNLNSIMFNLLNNAIKYRSSERTPEITIKTSLVGEYVLLSVKDNGLGIEKNQIDKIFGMFKRAHQHVEGTGMGLYIVKRIVENAGGKIEVDSIPERGSTFNVFLKITEIK